MRVLLGDCSGSLRGRTKTCVSIPMLNFHHGEKLDLLFDQLICSDVVLVTDDDIFWLDEEPLLWALSRLAEDPEIAVVSLMPKPGLSSVLQGKIEHAMGSVLVINRTVWQQEQLSFQVVHPPASENYDWHYDTGEFAQVELGRRGYRVEFAPMELQRHFVFFEGISSWTLKLQKYSGDLRAAIHDIPIRQEKALQTVFVLRGVSQLISELRAESGQLVSPRWLERAQHECERLLPSLRVEEVRQEVELKLGRLTAMAMGFDAKEALGPSIDRIMGERPALSPTEVW